MRFVAIKMQSDCMFDSSNSHLQTSMQTFCMWNSSNARLLNYFTASGCEIQSCCCMTHVKIAATDMFSPTMQSAESRLSAGFRRKTDKHHHSCQMPGNILSADDDLRGARLSLLQNPKPCCAILCTCTVTHLHLPS